MNTGELIAELARLAPRGFSIEYEDGEWAIWDAANEAGPVCDGAGDLDSAIEVAIDYFRGRAER